MKYINIYRRYTHYLTPLCKATPRLYKTLSLKNLAQSSHLEVQKDHHHTNTHMHTDINKHTHKHTKENNFEVVQTHTVKKIVTFTL